MSPSSFGGLGVACWPLVPKFAGSYPAEAVRFLRAKKSSARLPSSVLCRRFAACTRSLNGMEVVISAKLPDNILAHSSTFRRWDLSRRGGTWCQKWLRLKKRRGKQWQTTCKNLPRMRRTRAIPVAWLSSGLCPNWPKGWIPLNKKMSPRNRTVNMQLHLYVGDISVF
jgi:hypothetical protein